jgi:hypothetical protein
MRIPIDPELFCDGSTYVLTSESLGRSGLTPAELSAILFGESSGDVTVEDLLRDGVCLPLLFEGDCALDQETTFVVGDLGEQEQRDWIARLAWKLNVPCGKLLLVGGCAAEDLERACSGKRPKKRSVLHQRIEIPPGEYLVEVYAYLESITVSMFLEGNELEAEYRARHPGSTDHYVIRLAPLRTTPAMPAADGGWCGTFEFRTLD